ncbi:MAG: putative sugar nucleotidyl transferase, partial [Daejeonella sp.]
MNIILFDDQFRKNLLPLTFTRPVSNLRVGILTIAEKWQRCFEARISYLTQDYLQEKFPVHFSEQNLFINGSICPDEGLLSAIDKLSNAEALFYKNGLIAIKLDRADAQEFCINNLQQYSKSEYFKSFTKLSFPEDIFKQNDLELRKDFERLTKGRTSAKLSLTNTLLGNHIFVEEGVEAECSTFNTLQGPIYLGKNSQVWEGCHIRGSFALCKNSQVKMGAKIYGMTTIGPFSRVGGEINNSVIIGYSSKGHEGYLGNSVLGEWCNIGADSNNSNL